MIVNARAYIIDAPELECIFVRKVFACDDCRGTYRAAGVVRRGQSREVRPYILGTAMDGRGEPPCVCDLDARRVRLDAPGEHDHGQDSDGDSTPF